MIVAEQKLLEEIKAMLKNAKKVLAVGCGTCVTVCFAGGRHEVGVLSSSLRMAREVDGDPLTVDEVTVQRQCEIEYIDALADDVEPYDAVLSLGCGVGVQSHDWHEVDVEAGPPKNDAERPVTGVVEIVGEKSVTVEFEQGVDAGR